MSELVETEYIDITGDGGIMKKITKEGTGEQCPASGVEVHAHYTGTLLDDSVFDSSRTRGQIFKFTIGTGNVIKGWDIGFASMKKGETKNCKLCRERAVGLRNAENTLGSDPSCGRDMGMARHITKKYNTGTVQAGV